MPPPRADVGQRAGAVARDVEVAERLDVRARTVDRRAGEEARGRGAGGGGEGERSERGEQGDAAAHGTGWAPGDGSTGPGCRDPTGQGPESYGVAPMASDRASRGGLARAARDLRRRPSPARAPSPPRRAAPTAGWVGEPGRPAARCACGAAGRRPPSWPAPGARPPRPRPAGPAARRARSAGPARRARARRQHVVRGVAVAAGEALVGVLGHPRHAREAGGSTACPSGISCVRQGASRASRSTRRSTAMLAIRRQVVSLPPVMVIMPLEVSKSSALREMSTDFWGRRWRSGGARRRRPR